ncbi:prenyltransferase/squalene oxidase repeat-containing protein [Allorhodopirellula solitaria]|nr:prenyltransferase/squalene oxidase repeat-containing protein [Allorhodopirellula solitaria]
MIPSSRLTLRIALPLLLFVATLNFGALDLTTAQAYSVDDAIVVNMVEGGMANMLANTKTKPFYALDLTYSGGHGELCLAGYAVMKVHHDKNNAVVRRGVDAALAFLKMLNNAQQRNFLGSENKTLYTVSAAVLVLAEVDRKKYRPQLKLYEKYLRQDRESFGGYAYPGDRKGDVSQTQYAILALWTLDRAGIAVDYKGIQATIGWLLRVQDPGGGWPYLGEDPGSKTRIKQGGVTPSMAVAGGSALMIAADILEVWGGAMDEDKTGIVGLPEAVKLFQEDLVEDETSSDKPSYDPTAIRQSIEDCQRYLSNSKNSVDPGKVTSQWPYYQLYTLERYESFREVIMGDDYREMSGWYDIGVNYLKAQEQKGKGWPGRSYTTSSVSSAFAMLFLIRGTKKAIEQEAEGALAGGQGLPGDTTKIRVDGTQIKGEPVAEAVTDLLDMLEGDDPNALEGKSLPEDMQLPQDPKTRRAQIGRLERLVRGSSSYQARRVAARVLGQSDEIRVVPSLIFALDDRDTQVRTYARDGLRFISRKFEGFGMKIEPGEKQNYGELRKAQREWRNWYLTMDPGYVFLTQ